VVTKNTKVKLLYFIAISFSSSLTHNSKLFYKGIIRSTAYNSEPLSDSTKTITIVHGRILLLFQQLLRAIT